eukprot:126435-Rhodomonas_salina.3
MSTTSCSPSASDVTATDSNAPFSSAGAAPNCAVKYCTTSEYTSFCSTRWWRVLLLVPGKSRRGQGWRRRRGRRERADLDLVDVESAEASGDGDEGAVGQRCPARVPDQVPVRAVLRHHEREVAELEEVDGLRVVLVDLLELVLQPRNDVQLVVAVGARDPLCQLRVVDRPVPCPAPQRHTTPPRRAPTSDDENDDVSSLPTDRLRGETARPMTG